MFLFLSEPIAELSSLLHYLSVLIPLAWHRKMNDENGLFNDALQKRKTSLFSWRRRTMRPCDRVIQKTLELVQRMTDIADEGDAAREDVNCGVLYGVLRDSAYKIKQLAEKERESHVRKGWWDEKSGSGVDGCDVSPDLEIKEKTDDNVMVDVVQNNAEKGGK
jgi:hypothetical protein